jgi:cell division transport system permease protein
MFQWGRLVNASDEASHLRWLVMVLTALTGMTMAVLLATVMQVHHWQQQLDNTLTIQLPKVPKATLNKVIQAVEESPAVLSVTPLSTKDTEDLLSPWLGEGIKELPLPILLDVALKPGVLMDIDALKRRLANITKGVIIDKHAEWQKGMVHVARIIVYLAALAGVAFAALLLWTTWVVTGLNVVLNKQVLVLLQLMGATRLFIGWHLGRRMVTLAAQGSILGAMLGGIVLWVAVHALVQAVPPEFLPARPTDMPLMAIMLALPGAVCLLALIASQVAVWRRLS